MALEGRRQSPVSWQSQYQYHHHHGIQNDVGFVLVLIQLTLYTTGYFQRALSRDITKTIDFYSYKHWRRVGKLKGCRGFCIQLSWLMSITIIKFLDIYLTLITDVVIDARSRTGMEEGARRMNWSGICRGQRPAASGQHCGRDVLKHSPSSHAFCWRRSWRYRHLELLIRNAILCWC